MADFVHDQLLSAMDAKATWMNVISALTPVNARVPMHFPTDRAALAAAMQTLGHAKTNAATKCCGPQKGRGRSGQVHLKALRGARFMERLSLAIRQSSNLCHRGRGGH
jgi:hypothetical protein